MTADPVAWNDAVMAAALFAVDPVGTGGIWLRGMPGPARERLLGALQAALPSRLRRVPLSVSDDRLLGGLDLAATLRSGRPVAQAGLLAEADGGVVMLAMAERVSAGLAARLSAVLDLGEAVLERDGMTRRSPARLGVVALDEGIGADERPPSGLLDRLAFHVDLEGIGHREAVGAEVAAGDVAAARAMLGEVRAGEEVVRALCGTALALGIWSLRAPLLALRVACAAAALAGRREVSIEDAALAGRLVFARRATVMPADPEASEAPPEPEQPPDAPPEAEDPGGAGEEEQDLQGPLADIILQAAQAAMPADLLSALQLKAAAASRAQTSGRAGRLLPSARHGRPIGVRRGEPRGGARLHVIETLKAAAPWQRLRAAEGGAGRIRIRPDDFRVVVFKQRTGTTTVFVVDASGSAALQRLAETKGAVELLLADCYVRRDKVALIAFRGRGAELLLPPTNSLLRAKRGLAGLPGGGGTPLAAGIDAAVALADSLAHAGQTPILTFLTDGRANVSRDGTGGRAQAEAEAMEAAARVRRLGLNAVLVDTSPRPHPMAARLAAAMGARYVPLPYADATALSRAVRAA